MDKNFVFYRARNDCPYLPKHAARIEFFETKNMPADCYEVLLANGFRRSGKIFYRNDCPGCGECHEMRIAVSRFQPSRSQRRAVRKNKDVSVTLVSAEFRQDVYELYHRYSISRHGRHENQKDFREFLCLAPLDSRMALYRAGDVLLAVGWLDVLPGGLSSVYFAFEPEEARRSLGVFSIIKEIEIAKNMGLEYYYLGFLVDDSPKMSYKAAFLPHERLIDGHWVPYAGTKNPAPREENADGE